MRSYKQLIREAELMALSAESVATFLRERASAPLNSERYSGVDEETEVALLARGEPLINLALGAYAREVGALTLLFSGAPPGDPVRLACLSNRQVDSFSPERFPSALFSSNLDAFVDWLTTAPDAERVAFLVNPRAFGRLLADFLKSQDSWNRLPPGRLHEIVMNLSSNPALSGSPVALAESTMLRDHIAEARSAAWGLAERMAPGANAAVALSMLFENLGTDWVSSYSGAPEHPLSIASNWQAAIAGDDAMREETESNNNGFLGPYQEVRRGLARLALRQDSSLLGFVALTVKQLARLC